MEKTFLKFVSFIFAALLALARPFILLIFNVGRVLFDSELVKQVATEIIVDSKLIPAGAAWLAETQSQTRAAEVGPDDSEPDIVLLVQSLSLDDWIKIRNEALPDEFLIEWMSVAVDATYEWIDNEELLPDIRLDFRAFIQRMSGERGQNVVQIVFDALPPCTEAQIDDFKARLAAAAPGEEVAYNLCAFPDPWYADQISDYHASLLEVVANIPETFNLTAAALGTTEEAYEQELAQSGRTHPDFIKQNLRTIRLWAQLAPFTLLGFLVLILLFGVRSLRDFGLWWGIPLLLGGVGSVLLALTERALVGFFLAAGPLADTPALLQEETTLAALRLTNQMFRPMLIEAVVIIVVGLALVIVGARRPKA